jgi:hypothetical protein
LDEVRGRGRAASTLVCNVVPSDGSPVFTDGPFVESTEHLGGGDAFT